MIEHLRGRDRKLEPLGWTGHDAEWIALVCLHSGVFTRAQFCDYFSTETQGRRTDSSSHCWTAERRSKPIKSPSTAAAKRAAYRAR